MIIWNKTDREGYPYTEVQHTDKQGHPMASRFVGWHDAENVKRVLQWMRENDRNRV